jgi:uncharacterized protein (TIGR02145 family)
MKKRIYTWLIGTIFFLYGYSAFTQSMHSIESERLKDQDSIFYLTVKIGNQVWMAENLSVSSFRNGDEIKEVRLAEEWEQAFKNEEPAWCWYQNDSDTGKIYGKLYNWHAVNDPRGLAPKGWHIPSDAEWKQLEMYLGMSEAEAGKSGWRGSVAGKLKSERTAPAPHPRWETPNKGATNETGFSALPAGYRTGNPNYESQKQNTFRMLGKEAVFWNADGGGRGLWAERIRIFRGGPDLAKGFGFSVRCVKNE